MATAAAQGAPRVLRLRRPLAADPARKMPRKTEAIPKPQCRGPAAASETGPAARDAAPSGEGRGSKEK